MGRWLLLVIPICVGCDNKVECLATDAQCADEMALWTCIDRKNQMWYEFSDGQQIPCNEEQECNAAAVEAAAYCLGVEIEQDTASESSN